MKKVQGKIHKIIDLENFIPSIVLNTPPDPATFQPYQDISVRVVYDSPTAHFFPNHSVKSSVNSGGIFGLEVPDLSIMFKKMYILIFQKVGTIDLGVVKIPNWQPIYRSESFSYDQIKPDLFQLYISPIYSADNFKITQDDINRQGKEVKLELNLSKLSTKIYPNRIGVAGARDGAEIVFNLTLHPDTSIKLDNFIRHKIKDMDVDLPGPDFIVGMCVSEEDIEKNIKQATKGLIDEINQQIIDTTIESIANQYGGVDDIVDLVKILFEQKISMTIRQLRYPLERVDYYYLGLVGVKTYSIIIDPAFGYPRRIY